MLEEFEVHARKRLDCCELNVGRNMNVKGHSLKFQRKMRNRTLEIREKVTFTMNWQRTSLICVLVFCRR